MSRKSFIVVSDREGYVGAFRSVGEAQRVLGKYIKLPFIYTKWPDNSGKPEKSKKTKRKVWVLPYLENDVVAFASTVKKEVEDMQGHLLRLQLVPPEEVDHWESEIGTIIPFALNRLRRVYAVQYAVNKSTPGLGSKDRQTVSKFLNMVSEDGPIAKKLKEIKKVDILEGVITRPLPGNKDSQGETPKK
jgi:hypothetical protein